LGNNPGHHRRIKPGHKSGSTAEFNLLVQQFKAAYPSGPRLRRALTSLQEQVSGRFHKALIVLLCAVGAVLLMPARIFPTCCWRAPRRRRKEIAVRIRAGRRPRTA